MPRGYRARRTDSNHADVLAALRRVGAAVIDLHELGGALDALAGFRGVNYLLEIKDGDKPKSAQKLTEAELKTIAAFVAQGCPVRVVLSAEHALKTIGAID